MRRIMLSFFFSMPVITYIGASAFSNKGVKQEISTPIKKYRGYKLVSISQGLSATVSVEATSYIDAYRKGTREIEEYIYQDIKKSIKYRIPFSVYHTPEIVNYVKGKDSMLSNIISYFSPPKEKSVYTIFVPIDHSETVGTLRRPQQEHIHLLRRPAETVAVRRFRGFPTERKIQKNLKILEESLRRDGSEIVSYRIAEYHEQWVFYPFRKIEIIAKIKNINE